MGERPVYVIVNSIELVEVQKLVNQLIQEGYLPQQMIVSTSGVNQSRPRYIVPLIDWQAVGDRLDQADALSGGIKGGSL